MRALWKKKYHDYDVLLKRFSEYQEERAPNSYKNDVYYLEAYAFHYFLNEKQNSTYWQWSLHYREFRDWLKSTKPVRWERKNLSLNTQNKIIKALNVFLEMVARENGKPVIKCPQYKRSELNQVGSLDLLDESETKKIQEALLDISKESHDLFTVLANTGMRENEGIGLCVAFIFEGKIEGKKLDKLHNQLEQCKLGQYYGYICLESQPAVSEIRTTKKIKDRFGNTWVQGTVPRKPLKSRKKIEPENYRFIPIFDKKCWNILVDRWNHQQELLEKKTYGSDPRDYLLFDGWTSSRLYNDIAEAFEKTKLRYRSVHKCTRHTYLTWFYDVTVVSRQLKRATGTN